MIYIWLSVIQKVNGYMHSACDSASKWMYTFSSVA